MKTGQNNGSRPEAALHPDEGDKKQAGVATGLDVKTSSSIRFAGSAYLHPRKCAPLWMSSSPFPLSWAAPAFTSSLEHRLGLPLNQCFLVDILWGLAVVTKPSLMCHLPEVLFAAPH